MKIRTTIKSGALANNHNRTRLIRVRTGVKSGALTANHNRTRL